MGVIFTCGKCGHSFSVDQAQAGQWLPCPQCSTLVQPPPPPMAVGQGSLAQNSGLAIASMVLGIVGIVTCYFGVVFGLVAIILGIVALTEISKSEGRLTGKGFAIAGIVTGGVPFLVAAVFAMLLLPALGQARSVGREAVCKSNLAQIGKGLMVYAGENNGFYPYDERGPLYSVALLFPAYIDDVRVFVCPEVGGDEARMFPDDSALAGNRCSYGYNHVRLDPHSAGPGTPVMADMPGNHKTGYNVLYFDGRVSHASDVFAGVNPKDNIFLDDVGVEGDAWIRQ